MHTLYQKTGSTFYEIIMTCQHKNEAEQLVARLIGPHPHTFETDKSTQYYAHHNIDGAADFIIVSQ